MSQSQSQSQRPKDYDGFIEQEQDKERRKAFYCPSCFRLKAVCKCPPKPKKDEKKDEKK